jgi:hypothetical protein
VDDEYYKVETIIDLLCNYLIVERKNGYLSLNGFAEKYIISRFMPDSIAYQKMFSEISGRRRKIKDALERLKIDKCERPELASILRDWAIVNDSDLYLSAKLYSLYGRTEQACRDSSRYWIESALDDLITECNEAERITAHPYIKYQKARILQIIDDSRVLDQIHDEEIKKSYEEAIYVINMVGQYSSIQQTKSYASMLWIYGQYLYFQHDIEAAIKYLETSEKSFKSQGIDDEQYNQCCTLLATCYLDYYAEKKEERLLYLRQARKIDSTLQAVFRRERYVLGKATKYAISLHDRLSRFGQY